MSIVIDGDVVIGGDITDDGKIIITNTPNIIGGNITAKLQAETTSQNEIGESVSTYADKYELTGWLDFTGGSSYHNNYNGKFQESTHIFICDYVEIDLKPEECRFVYNGDVYEVLIIDDPMELHEQLEILLKYVGVQ